MDWKIIVAAIGFGAGAEILRRYQRWKSRRRDQPTAVRNAGLVTDARLLWVETIVIFAVVAVPFTILVAALFTRGLWPSYAGLLAYAAFSFLLLRGLNRYQEP